MLRDWLRTQTSHVNFLVRGAGVGVHTWFLGCADERVSWRQQVCADRMCRV